MNMKRILLMLLVLGITCGHGYCDTAPTQLQLTADKTEIFTTEFPTYTVKITNMSTTDLSVLNTDYTGADKVWSVDNPRVALAQPSYGPRLTPQGIHILKPGDTYEDQPRIFFPERISDRSWESRKPDPITLRVGFKITPDAQPVWSNPVTISFKTYENLSATNTKLEFKDIVIDTNCYPYGGHIKGATAAPVKPIIEDKLIINDEQTYKQTFEKRVSKDAHICSEESGYEECMKFACKGLPDIVSDPQKLKTCAENLCRVSGPNNYKRCLGEQERDNKCLPVNLPPVDFSKETVLAQYTSGYCGTTDFKREVFKDDKTKTITYFVSAVNTIAACMGGGGASMNLIAVPKIPADYRVVFSYKFP